MAKQFDYYAGYPNQQRTPKWVGVAIGSIFGGVTLIALALGIRIAMPARTAQASTLPAQPAPAAQPAAPILAAPAAVAAAEEDGAPVVDHATNRAHHRMHGAKAKHGHAIAVASKKPSKADKKFKRTQMYAKSVSSSRRDKRARDDLDHLLGL